MIKIKLNRIKCKKCGDIITSEYTHNFKWCSCHSVAVDGGNSYLKRCGDLESYEDLSECEGEEDNDDME